MYILHRKCRHSLHNGVKIFLIEHSSSHAPTYFLDVHEKIAMEQNILRKLKGMKYSILLQKVVQSILF